MIWGYPYFRKPPYWYHSRLVSFTNIVVSWPKKPSWPPSWPILVHNKICFMMEKMLFHDATRHILASLNIFDSSNLLSNDLTSVTSACVMTWYQDGPCSNCEGKSTMAIYGWHGETPRITLGKSCSGNTGCSWPGISGMLFLKKIVDVSSQQKCTAHFGVPVPLHPSTQTAPQAVQQPCHHQKGYGCSPTMEHLSTADFASRIDEDWWYSPRILLNHWTSKTDQHTYLVLLECSTLVHDSWFLLLPLSDHKTTRSLFFSHHM